MRILHEDSEVCLVRPIDKSFDDMKAEILSRNSSVSSLMTSFTIVDFTFSLSIMIYLKGLNLLLNI